MSDTSVQLLPDHPAFGGLSAAGVSRLQGQLQCRQLGVGESLCSAGLIPAEILLIAAGSARLLVRDQGRLATAARLGPGDFVGLASLLRAAPCEDVSAASDVEVWAIPDGLILELLKSEPSFAHWCGCHLFTAELVALLALLQQQHPRSGTSLLALLAQAEPHAQLVAPEPAALAALPADHWLLAASHNHPPHP
ncbi:MAG: cyclic nucleotide-binding domain-containing protein, partial [Cyanobacteria bacterium]|nr:cyclic nucleotide-binding domain-containing protein [Cyanobacteria bacterium bin.275]